MSRWFRHYAGMCRDPKFGGIARRAKTGRDRVVFVFSFILEEAAERNNGGSFSWDADSVADLLNCDTTEIERVYAELQAAGIIVDDCVAKWRDRQYESDKDATNAERQARYKARHKPAGNGGNGPVTGAGNGDNASHSTETELDTEKKEREDLLSEKASDLSAEQDDEKAKPKKKISYPAAFDGFWTDYPTDGLMSKKDCHTAWKRLDDEDRAKALRGIPALIAHAKANPTYRMVHACRYLSQRRFDGLAEQAPTADSNVIPEFATEEARQEWWQASLRARHADRIAKEIETKTGAM